MSGLEYIQSTVYANGGHIKPEVGAFNAKQYYGNGAHVTGLKIWLRKYGKDKKIIGGFQVFYSTGQSPVHGCCRSKEAVEIQLEKDEKITQIQIKSGWLIDSLAFHTSKGDVFGPYGGTGGGQVVEKPPNGRTGHLAGISGTVVQEGGAQAITRLCFTWACQSVMTANYQESSIYAIAPPNYGVLSTFDGKAYIRGTDRINGLKIWVRRNVKPVIAGIQFRFTNGTGAIFGGTGPKEIYEFTLQPDEKINQVQLYLADVLEGFTVASNKGRHFGPYGNTTGACVHETPSAGSAALAWMSGTAVRAHGGQCLTSIKFGWLV